MGLALFYINHSFLKWSLFISTRNGLLWSEILLNSADFKCLLNPGLAMVFVGGFGDSFSSLELSEELLSLPELDSLLDDSELEELPYLLNLPKTIKYLESARNTNKKRLSSFFNTYSIKNLHQCLKSGKPQKSTYLPVKCGIYLKN